MAQPGYYGGYPPPPPPRQTNTMAILALVFAFVMAPVAIILGVMARNQIKRTGEDGWGLATAGLICGIVFTALWVIGIVAYVVLIVTLIGEIPNVPTHTPEPFPTR
jgi:hypothetical protein